MQENPGVVVDSLENKTKRQNPINKFQLVELFRQCHPYEKRATALMNEWQKFEEATMNLATRNPLERSQMEVDMMLEQAKIYLEVNWLEHADHVLGDVWELAINLQDESVSLNKVLDVQDIFVGKVKDFNDRQNAK